MSSINSNISAYYAQNNLRKASADSQASIAKLSSGNRIIRASDDVAALSIGTILRTNVSTLKTALSNANQGSTLLQVADGAVARLGEILQRQKSLSVQANSGTLSNSERGYLNQEFQALKTEYDRIVTSTNFNGVKLLDGNLFDGAAMKADQTLAIAATTAAAGVTYALNATQPTDGATITVNGATVTFTTDATRTDRVFVGANITETGENLANFLNASSDARITVARYTNAAGTITATYSGGRSDNAVSFAFANGTYTNGTATGSAFGTGTTVGGDMNGRIGVSGTVGDSILTNLANQATGSTAFAGINTTALRNNPDFIGKISGFNVEWVSATNVIISLKVGDVTYSSGSQAINAAGDITMTGVHSDSTFETAYDTGSFTMRLSGAVTNANQADSDLIAKRLDAAFSTLDFFASRDVTSLNPGTKNYTGSTETANLVNVRVDYRSNDFSDVSVSDIKVEAPLTPGANSTIEMTINGERFVTVNNVTDRIATNGMIILSSVDDPRKSMTIQMGGTTLAGQTATSVLIRNSEEANTFENALKAAFGVGVGGSAISFQVGTGSDDQIGVNLKNVGTSNVYKDANGVYTDLDISTQAGAVEASNILDLGIKALTSVRADVGALQSRFGYAVSTLEVSIQNLDAARGSFLDADISEESTKFASAQVLQQAAISVLAQANQIPQNLLKLIG